MKDWKVRQKIYHSINNQIGFGDSLLNEKIIEEFDEEKIVLRALQYPQDSTEELYYPGKSFAIAIIYAFLLEKNFSTDFYEALDDQDLLFNNDPYFVPYSQAQTLYDRIIKKFPFDLLLSNQAAKRGDHLNKTLTYFDKEFLLDSEGGKFAPARGG